MPKDLRDPKLLGEALFKAKYRRYLVPRPPLTFVADRLGEGADLRVADYDANPGTLEKYGRPQDLPPTPF